MQLSCMKVSHFTAKKRMRMQVERPIQSSIRSPNHQLDINQFKSGASLGWIIWLFLHLIFFSQRPDSANNFFTKCAFSFSFAIMRKLVKIVKLHNIPSAAGIRESLLDWES